MALDHVLTRCPKHADGLHLRGLVAFASNQGAAAQIWITRAIECLPDAQFYNSLCVVQTGMKAFARASQSAREGLALQPDSPTLCYNLGLALQLNGDFADAAVSYRKAIELAPAHSAAHNNLGTVLKGLGKVEAAVEHYRYAVELAPENSAAHNNLGSALEALGELEAAQWHYRRAIAIAPRNCSYYRNLVQSKRLTANDPCFISMEKLAQDASSLTREDQVQLQFAFGQALADAGQKERSFEHLQQANALHRPSVCYDEVKTLGLFKHIPELLTADFLKANRGKGDPSDSPIFIVGMPRSGSTLIEQILASHLQVFGVGERPDFEQALLSSITRSGNAACKIDIEALRAVSTTQLASLGTDYLRRSRLAVDNARNYRRISNKYLFNFIYLGLIHLALPNARFIHSRRAPVETCMSIYSRLFHDIPFGYDLGELGRYYRAYDDLMAYWRSVLPEGIMIEVQYEDLVNDFEFNVRRMLTHCALDWDERCTVFHQTRRLVFTASAGQVREPLFRTSLKRRYPQTSLQPLLDGLGPELLDGQFG